MLSLRALLEPLSTSQLVTTCAKFEVDQLDTPTAMMRSALAAIAKRWLQLHDEIETHTQHLSTLTRSRCSRVGTSLRDWI